MFHRFLVCSITALTATGCASGGGGAGAESAEELEAPVLMGAYQLEAKIYFNSTTSGSTEVAEATASPTVLINCPAI